MDGRLDLHETYVLNGSKCGMQSEVDEHIWMTGVVMLAAKSTTVSKG